ncbi:MAG: transcriptional regulator [Chloroflexota bacterium]|nr:transcriptional regulator [Chloroflexota bacterium]
MPAKPIVIVAAADRVVRLLVASALRGGGFRVAENHGPRPTEEDLADLRPDVIVLEAEEPPLRAFDSVRLAASSGIPILLMSPLATPTRVAEGLDAGADDYIARPFDPAELRARVRSLVRRRRGRLRAGRTHIGSVIVDLDARTISRGERSVSLTREEWTLLATLLQSSGRIVFREELLTAAFGEAFRDDMAQLRLSISRLRRKLGLQPWDEGPIRTIHGIGYVYDPDDKFPRTWSGRRRATSEVRAGTR